MKLWVLAMIRGVDYDEVDSVVVRAPDEGAARELMSVRPHRVGSNYVVTYGDEGAETWLNPEKSTCTELLADGDTRIIIRSFNAG